jgi:choline-sulfatase
LIFEDKSFDHHVKRTSIPRDAGLEGDTQVVYTSDHGDNLGTRGLWGKSTFYEESVAVPLIMAGLDIGHGVCDAPVDLLDLSVTITNHFDT